MQFLLPFLAILGALQGVYPDGSTPTTARVLSQPIVVPRFDTGEIDVAVVNSAGAPFSLSGYTPLLTVRHLPSDLVPVVARQGTITDSANGKIKFPIVPGDTLTAYPGYYQYDVVIVDGSGNQVTVVPASAFVIQPSLSQPGQSITVPPSQLPLAQGPPGPQPSGGIDGQIVRRVSSLATWSNERTPDPTSIPDGQVLQTVGGLATWSNPARPGQTGSILATSFNGSFGPWLTVQADSVPADVTQVRIRISTRGTSLDSGQDNAATTGCDLAVGMHDGNFGFAGAPAYHASFNIPAAGIDYLSPWIPITRGSDGKILVAVGIPAASAVAFSSAAIAGAHWSKTAAQTTAYPLPALADTYLSVPTWTIEYLTSARRVVVLGDSLSAGGYADYAVQVWRAVGSQLGISVDNRAVSGSTIDDFLEASGAPNKTEGCNFVGTDVVLALGTNNVRTGSETLDVSRRKLGQLVTQVKAHGARHVYLVTLTPSGPTNPFYSGQTETNRNIWNAWIKQLPYGAAGAIDFDLALRDPADHAHLLSAYDSGDGTGGHWSQAGNVAATAPATTTLSTTPTPGT